MNKKDYKMLEEAYSNILLKEFDNGETETPEEMEHEKIGMLKNNLRKVIDHATGLLEKLEEGSVTDVPPWAEEKIAIGANMLVGMADTLQAIVDNHKQGMIDKSRRNTEF
jgi:hypothetical protein